MEAQVCGTASFLIFELEAEDRYKCSFCTKLLYYPVFQTKCGHRISKACLDIMLKGVDNCSEIMCPAHDDECETISRSNVHPDKATERELKKMMVHCNIPGCDTKTTLVKIFEHQENCPSRTVSCLNNGCSGTYRLSEIDDHTQNKCQYTLLECGECEKKLTRLEFENNHKECCVPVQKQCPLHIYGCTYKDFRNGIKEHLFETMISHFTMLAEKVSSQSSEMLQMQNLMQDASNFISDYQSKVTASQLNSAASLNTYATSDALAVLKDNMSQIQQNMQEKADRTQLAQIHGELMKLIETSHAQHKNETVVEGNTTDLVTRNRDIERKIVAMETQLGECETKIADSEIRFRLIETACYEGKLIWKLTQYNRRKQDALSGSTLSLYSQPFYTSIHGYKMCGRVYLNGDGMGRGTHISMFFVVMRGEYDALLTWPFRQKITLSILDQSGSKRHISDSFRPDPTSASFQQPTKEMNIASGSPMFATHAQIENGTYLKNDTLFIRISVDTSDITDI